MATFDLEVIDAAIARFVVRDAASPSIARVTQQSATAPPVHDVVYAATTRHRLSQPWAPDDGMILETFDPTIAEGGAPPASILADVEWKYMEWAEGSLAESGGGLLGALPDGSYWLARTKLEATAPKTILLGNAWSPAPSNARQLADRRPLYAAAFGVRRGAPPSGASPLVGLAVLDYVGDASVDATLFFEIVEAKALTPDRSGDVVVVIPQTGALVVDALEAFSASDAQEARLRWERERSRALAQLLGDSYPTR
ncbi:MAG: hypothetical protein KF819_11740 [Labilithrix sp.]|nr:hypothetical protein [Labilithrix sp.]